MRAPWKGRRTLRTGTLVWRNFRAYMVQNLVMLLLLCLVMIPVCLVYYQINMRTTMEREQSLLDGSVGQLNSQLTTLESLLVNVCTDAEVNLLSIKTQLEPVDHLTLNTVYNDVLSLCVNSELLADLCLVLDNSQTVISASGCFTTLGGVSGVERFLSFYKLPEHIASYIMQPDALGSRINFMDGVVLALTNQPQPQAVSFLYAKKVERLNDAYVFWFIAREELEELFGALSGRLTLYSHSGKEIASFDNDCEQDMRSTDTLSSAAYTRLHGKLAVSDEAVHTVMQTTVVTLLVFVISLVLFSLLLASVSAYRLIVPVRQMVSKLSEYGFHQENHDETFHYFLSCMEHLHDEQQIRSSELTSLKRQLDHRIIERCLYMPAQLTQEETPLSLEQFPQRYAVGYAVLAVPPGAEEPDLQLPLSITARLLMQDLNAILVPINPAAFVLIIPADSDDDQQLVRLARLLEDSNAKTHLPISMTVSHVCTGLRQLNAAFESSRACMVQHASAPGLHREDTPGERPESIPYFSDCSQLYEAVLSGDSPQACLLIQRVLMGQCPFADLEQRYYYLRMPLLLAIRALERTDMEDPPGYSPHFSPDWLCAQLICLAEALCEGAMLSRQSSGAATVKKQDLTDRVMRFMSERFVCDDLSVQAVCEACDVSEHMLNEICRSTTGMNVFAYIQQLRMDKASAMLRNTDEKVVDILHACGYNTPNTFYKAFKRVYGKSPSEYRAAFRSQ